MNHPSDLDRIHIFEKKSKEKPVLAYDLCMTEVSDYGRYKYTKNIQFCGKCIHKTRGVESVI